MATGLSEIGEMGFRSLTRSFVLKASGALGLCEFGLKRGSSEIVVVAMHETLSQHAPAFQSQLEWVAKHFTFITPEMFLRAFETGSQSWPGSKPAVLFTFDDGRESNYRVGASLIESFGGRGIFFIVPRFIGLKDNAARDFYYSKIDVRNIGRPDVQEEVWRPMTSEQLADLSKRGHWIGSHSLSHTRLDGMSAPELQQEIETSAEEIAGWIGKRPESFAGAYAWDAIDGESWKAIKRTYRMCFSPCPGTVELGADSQFLIWRKEIESYYSPAEYRFMYSGLEDFYWARKRERLSRILREADDSA
jgi:peptidoglycan/xylan/chitin deacetylase (PgdA/CDA1 family)